MYKPLDPKKLSLAISADIMAMLTRSEVIGVFELRRIKHISDMCIDLVNSVGTIHEGPAYMALLRRIEDLCPNVNALLQERVFDGEAVLQASYETLKRGYSETFANEMRVLEAVHGEVRKDQQMLQLSQSAFQDNVTRFAALKAGVAPDDMRSLAAGARAALPAGARGALPAGGSLAAACTTLDGRPLPPGWRRAPWPNRPDAESYEHETARIDTDPDALAAYVVIDAVGNGTFRWEGVNKTCGYGEKDPIEAMLRAVPVPQAHRYAPPRAGQVVVDEKPEGDAPAQPSVLDGIKKVFGFGKE